MGLRESVIRFLGRTSAPAPEAPIVPPSNGGPKVKRGRARAEYDGATLGRRAAGWRRNRLDANSELTPATRAALNGVARDLDRNNPWAHSGANKIAEHMVGTGITFQILRNGKIDKALSEIARAHFDTTSCDSGGRLNLYGLQLQAARTIVVSGAVLLRRRWRRKSDRLPLPFQLQLLEPDYIDPTKHGPTAAGKGGFAVHGIEFDAIGKRTGYWLYNDHPGSARSADRSATFVQAADVAHVFRADRPEQEHGATWFAPVILRLKDFADYEDAQLNRQKIAASFAGFVKDDGTGQLPGVEEDEERPELDYIEPGTLTLLSPGQDVTFANPPSIDGYMDFSRVSQRAVSAGLGVPYELLTGDISQVSFISGRFGRLTFNRALATWQWNMFIPQFCHAVERWMLEALAILGHDLTGVTVQHTPPKHEMLNPAEEVKANRDAVRSGQKTPSQVVRENGDDPDTFFEEMKADFDRLDRLGLILDIDPRRVTQVGQPTDPNAATSEGIK